MAQKSRTSDVLIRGRRESPRKPPAPANLSSVSKAFTKEDDAAEEPLPPYEPPLPPGAPNYMTREGAERLRRARQELEGTTVPTLKKAIASEPARAHELREAQRRLRVLEVHLERAQIVDLATQPRDHVAFGAYVAVHDDEKRREYRIVGIDEADAARGWISWTSPIARALANARVGDTVTVQLPRGPQELEVVAVRYEEDGESGLA